MTVRLTLAALAAAALAGASAAPPPRLVYPADIEVGRRGDVLIADGEAHRILRYTPRTGRLAVFASGLGIPIGLARDRAENLYVADLGRHVVQRVTPSGRVTVIAGTGRNGHGGDGGPARRAAIGQPADVAVSPDGSELVIATLGGYVRRVSLRTGTISTLAGDGTAVSSGDGGPAVRAGVERPHGVAYDRSGNVLIADFAGSIRRVDRATGVITTIAGRGVRGFSGDGGPATAAAIEVTRLWVAPSGAIYFNGGGFPAGGRVRVVGADGRIRTVAGNGRLRPRGDGGPATAAGLNPSAMALAADGSLLVAQVEPAALRRVDLRTGRISTLLGRR